MKKLHLAALGCCKNLVDAEKILYGFAKVGWQLTDEAREADAIVVNTCGFIESAKQEAIDTILELAAEKKDGCILVATGCMAQRYPEAIFEQMPEVDLVVGIDLCEHIVSYVENFTGRQVYMREPIKKYETGKRLYTGMPHYAYVRIADGCDNFCTYCAIPKIRGRYRSRDYDEIMAEVRELAANGVREIILVAQDTTRYGQDTGTGSLSMLLHDVAQVEGVEWVRFLYAYPEMLTDEVIDVICAHDNICKYVDIPIQHCSDPVLKRMNRRIKKVELEALLAKLHDRGISVRTTVMTGFPGETEQQHEELLSFLAKWKFDRLGAFAFCPEDGTAAEKMDGQIDEETKQRRLDEIMTLQQGISLEINESRVGKTYPCVVDSFDFEENTIIARSTLEVPEVDGTILIPLAEDEVEPAAGMVLDVRITKALPYDLMGELQ